MAKSLSSRELIKMLKDDGWRLAGVEGDHHQFKHPVRLGRVTVPHPQKDIPVATLRSIYRQAGWDWTKRR